MNKIKLLKRVDKVNFALAILNLILWTALFIFTIFLNLSDSALKDIAVCSTFVVVLDIFLDILAYRRKNNGKVQ